MLSERMSQRIPFEQHEERVRSEWIDYSGHMNVGYYLLPFENAIRAFARYLDLSQDYRDRTNHALFAAETHITFEREVRQGDRLRFTTQLLGWSPKWINCFHCMYQADEDYLAATNQILFVHVNLEKRRAGPIPKRQQATLKALMDAHSKLPVPPQAGRAIRPGGQIVLCGQATFFQPKRGSVPDYRQGLKSGRRFSRNAVAPSICSPDSK